MSSRSKRKLNKSGEKVSPKDKKSKSVKSYMVKLPVIMASANTGEQNRSDNCELSAVPSTEWQKLMQKIDDIDKRTKGIKDIKDAMTEVKKDVNNLRTKCESMQTALDEYANRTINLEKKMEDLGKTHELIELLETELKATETENTRIKEHLLSQECYSRRDNLIFEGIKEQEGKDTYAVLKDFLITTLHLEPHMCQDMLLANCHRLGNQRHGNPRPIIARFILEKDRSSVWLKKSSLKGLPFVIREDYPAEIVNRRKFMYPLFVEARKQDKSARLLTDKIFFKGKTYNYSNAYELAQIVNFLDKGTRQRNGFTIFHGRTSVYSNFFPAPFKDGNTKFTSSEQMYQHELCLYFGDAHAARQVMLQTDPVAMKKIGDRVAITQSDRREDWYKHRAREVMATAVFLKFTKNPILLQHLCAAEGQFVEANFHDHTLKDDDIFNPSCWKGKNWLGEILSDLKDKISSKGAQV